MKIKNNWLMIGGILLLLFLFMIYKPFTISPSGLGLLVKGDIIQEGDNAVIVVLWSGYEQLEYGGFDVAVFVDGVMKGCRNQISRQETFTVQNPSKGFHSIDVRGVLNGYSCNSGDLYNDWIEWRSEACPPQGQCIKDSAKLFMYPKSSIMEKIFMFIESVFDWISSMVR